MAAHVTTVEGKTYRYWADFTWRCTLATDGKDTHKISDGGYISNDLTVRKAIASAFGHSTFRK